MNNFYRKKLLIFGIFLCTLILSLNIFSISVSADGDSDYDHALATTPKGLNWDNNNFVIAKFPPKPANAPATSPTGKKYSYDNNASIVQSTNPATKGTSVISLTNGTYQVGAVWSNFEKDNYFDLSHEQVASMWIYFGNTGGEAPGDGMAFVLQNDKRKENAIAL
ncbi:lectin-like domain-containing protein, partial [Companilactobacillus bobalius]